MQRERHRMPSMINASRVIDSLYGDSPDKRIPRSEIFKAATAVSMAPDVLTYFRRLPDGEYTKRDLIRQLNKEVKARQRVAAIGQFTAALPRTPRHRSHSQ